MNLREIAVKGIAWSATEKWGSQAFNFLVFLVLARLLQPEAFGLVALASAFTAFVQIFLDQGMAEAIVQRTDLEREHLDTAFWINMLTGSLLTFGGVLFSGLVGNLLGEPQLRPIAAWLSLSFLLIALRSTQQAILQRRLDFRGLALRTLVATLSGGIAGVGTALLGFGVWSLVVQNLVNALVGVLVLWRVSDWRPGFRFSKKHFQELFAFGLNIVGLRVLGFANTHLDVFLIGYLLGPTALGYYTVAYRILRIVIGLLRGITSTVAFPAFSRLQQQPKRVRRALYQAIQFTSLLSFPILLGIAVLAPELVPALFGARWTPAIPVMQVLALGGLQMSVLGFHYDLLKGLGKPSWMLGLSLLHTSTNLVGFTITARWGIVAVAAVFAFTRCAFAPLSIWMIHRMVHLDFGVYFRQYTTPLAGSLAMVATVLSLKYVLRDWLGLDGLLIICGLAGAVVYLVMVQLMNPSLLRRLLDLARLTLPRQKCQKGSPAS
jgi:O-antigen/teichoic acid export membrane protein